MVHDITTHRNIFDSLIENYTAEDIIRALSPCFTEERIKRIAGTIENRMSSIHVAIEEPYDIHNALAVVRSAEALGVNTVHIINPIIRKRTSGKKTMQGTDRWAECYRHPSLEAFSSASRGLIIAGACVDGDVTLEDLPVDKPICLLFGNESIGLSEEARALCDIRYRIPMYGMVESFNLSVSAALSLYDLTRRKRDFLGVPGDLSPEEVIEYTAWYYVRALGIHKAKMILARTKTSG